MILPIFTFFSLILRLLCKHICGLRSPSFRYLCELSPVSILLYVQQILKIDIKSVLCKSGGKAQHLFLFFGFKRTFGNFRRQNSFMRSLELQCWGFSLIVRQHVQQNPSNPGYTDRVCTAVLRLALFLQIYLTVRKSTAFIFNCFKGFRFCTVLVFVLVRS